MPGRNAKPVDLQVLEGNPNRLTKAEIERRKAAEVKLGKDKFTVPDYVKEDPVAYKKWKQLVKEYKSLIKQRMNISDLDYLDTGELDIIEEYQGQTEAKRLYNKINYIISTEGILKIDTAINKKQDMLILRIINNIYCS